MVKQVLRKLKASIDGYTNLFKVGHPLRFSVSSNGLLLTAANRWIPVLPYKYRPRTIIDVGAYRGLISLELCKLYNPDNLVLIEPNPILYSELTNLKFDVANVSIYSCALGEKPGEAPFNIIRKGNQENFASSSFLKVSDEAIDQWNLKDWKQVNVPIKTLDDVLEDAGVSGFVDLLKIDVQGYEKNVILGAERTLEKTRVIVIEMSFFSEYHGQCLFEDVYHMLKERGFELSEIFEVTRKDGWQPLQCNGVFLNLKK